MILRAFRTALIFISLIQPVAAEETVGKNMEVGGRTTPPVGHVALCKAVPWEAGPTDWDGPLLLSDEIMATISEINRAINHKIRRVSDQEQYGVEERWIYPRTAGDVEDVALLKRKELAAKGIAVSNLLLTVALAPSGEGTALVTVTTDKGDFVLDQATDDVKLWSEVPYKFLKRQSHEASDKWEKIVDVRSKF